MATLVASAALAGTLGMVTGPKTGTYIAFGRDIAKVAKGAKINIDVKASDGSIDNIKRLNSTENAGIGIVQSDVLGFMKRSHNAETMRLGENLRMLLPLYREEVHVLVRGSIQSFEALEEKRVVVGENGSGHMITATNLLAMMSVTPKELIRKAPPEGVLALLDGSADAVIFVGGKPVKLFQNLNRLSAKENAKYQALLSDLHFIPMNAPKMLEEYQEAELTAKDYPFIIKPVPTIAVTAVLVAYDFSGKATRDQARCKDMKILVGTLKKNLKLLQKNGHPKWREVTFDTALPIWQKDSCAWPNTKEKTPAKTNPSSKPKANDTTLDKDLIEVIKQR